LVFLLIKVYPEKSPKDLPKTNDDEQTKQTFLQNKEEEDKEEEEELFFWGALVNQNKSFYSLL